MNPIDKSRIIVPGPKIIADGDEHDIPTDPNPNDPILNDPNDPNNPNNPNDPNDPNDTPTSTTNKLKKILMIVLFATIGSSIIIGAVIVYLKQKEKFCFKRNIQTPKMNDNHNQI